MTEDPDALTVPAVQVQLRVVRNVPVMVRVPPPLLMFTIGRSAVAAYASVHACGPPPLMRSVPEPPRKVDATAMSPWAAMVPVFTDPPVRVSVPSTVIVLAALMVLVPDRNCTLLKVAAPPRFKVTLLVENTTVPLLWAKTPAASVTAPVTVKVPVVLVNEPPAATVSAPFRLIVEPPPLNVPPALTVAPPPTVMVEAPPTNVPAAWV